MDAEIVLRNMGAADAAPIAAAFAALGCDKPLTQYRGTLPSRRRV